MMLPPLSSTALPFGASCCSIFPHSSNHTYNWPRRRRSALSRRSSPCPCVDFAVEFRARRPLCRALGFPAEDATSTKEESLEAEGLTFELESNVDASGDNAETIVAVGSPNFPMHLQSFRTSLGDQAFFTLAFIACTTAVAFTSLVVAAIPTLWAMRRAAISFARLADTAQAELPSTMAAMRLSGMEISDLTLELSELSQEIADGVSKSAEAVQAAEAGIRNIGQLARRQTMNMIEERASLPDISLQPVVEGAAKKTSRVFGQVRKTLLGFISKDRVDD
ncbi:chitinase-like protein [Wolffia australiana]